MRISVPKIVNVRYKNVIYSGDFKKTELEIAAIKGVHRAIDNLGEDMTGYFFCAAGDQGRMVRTYFFETECVLNVGSASEIITNMLNN